VDLLGSRRGSSPKDLWRQLELSALERLRDAEGVVTVDRTDLSQRNLLLSLERLVNSGTVARVAADGPYATYRLRE